MDCHCVHILFCDHDPSSGSETVALLQKCCYKVTTVNSAREVVEALNAEDSDVDIVLADVELPLEKSFKMLKHILGKGNLSHVAVVVMSERDDMAIVAKCLRLGAVDYLVKPLRSNEVLNLWTHMWRRRRMLGLPDKCVAESNSFHANLSKPDATVDLLSGYCSKRGQISALDAQPPDELRDCTSPQLELSLRLALDYNAEMMPEQVIIVEPVPASPVSERVANSSAFSIYVKSSNQQSDEQSASNVCSPRSQFPEKTRHCKRMECAETGFALADTYLDSSKDTSAFDENRLVDVESQVCGAPQQPPVPSLNTQERILHAGQMPSLHPQGFQPCFTFVESSPDMRQSITAALQDGCAGYANPTLPSSQVNVQPLHLYHHEAGMANVSSAPNVYSYYPVAHLAVPVVGFTTWPQMISSPNPMAGSKLIQAERREAALSKFRLKRKGRCFEKKIRYASRKKLAEQRPRVRGQFVKRTAMAGLIETAAIQGGFDEEEGEADDEQGCSEPNNQSSPECLVGSCRDG